MKKSKPDMRTADKKPASAKRGPKEEVLKVNGDWRNAIKASFLKKKPKAGWPT